MGAVTLENLSTSPNPNKVSVFALDVSESSWMEPILRHTAQKRCIGALEIIGALLLCILAVESVDRALSMSSSPCELTTRATRTRLASAPPGSGHALPSWWNCPREHLARIFPSLTHVKRCSNTWADQLTHLDFAGFNPALSRDVSSSWDPQWILLDQLLELKLEEE